MISSDNTAIHTDLVLVGGGHSHLFVLRHFAMHPHPGVRLTLVTRDLHTPYSGMLPGFIAGHYRFDETHIDLQVLARHCAVGLIHAEVTGIDADAGLLRFADRPSLSYDLLSLNIGSRPYRANPDPIGDQLSVKPVDGFLAAWTRLQERLSGPDELLRMAVVGGGAGGVELALALDHRAGQLPGKLRLELFTDAPELLSGHNAKVRESLAEVMHRRSLPVHTDTRVERFDGEQLHTQDDRCFAADAVIWATHASAPAWLAESGLALDEHGFVEVDEALRSVSHAQVFAAGDIASVPAHPRPKSGVFAVRQGLPLARNLSRQLRGQTLKPFRPQQKFLSLISTGDRNAVASRGDWALQGRWCWWLKNWIDRRFMRRFSEFPAMSSAEQQGAGAPMRCAGCGAKVGGPVLRSVLHQVAERYDLDAAAVVDHADDAALIEVPPGRQLVQSVDHFRAFVDDAYLFGRIAANHALGDLFAMGARADSALVVATVPYADEATQARDLLQLMSGVASCLSVHAVKLVGGHSGEAAEMACGLTVNGFAEAAQLMLKSGLRNGDALILTKPLGTGILLAGEMRGRARGAWIEAALESMQQSSEAAAICLRQFDATGCTDVTGFGLAGHLLEMLDASDRAAEIDLDRLPALPGAEALSADGIASSLAPQNRRVRRRIEASDEHGEHPCYPLLFDPQTAGGLLGGVEAARAQDCVTQLRELGYAEAGIVGRVIEPIPGETGIRLLSP